MTGDGEQVDIPRFDIDGEVPSGLCSVNKNKDVVVFSADRFDCFFDILDCSEDI